MADYSKIHGDIVGLNSSGQDLATAASGLSEVTHVLNNRVNELVHDAGWSGSAASAFRQDWQVCSDAGDAIIEAMSKLSTAMEHLAAVLAEAQSDLDDAKDYARVNKVSLDSSGQVIEPSPGLVPGAPTIYQAMAEKAVNKANTAREDADITFASIVSQLAPGGGSDKLGTSDDITLADAARSLYAIPAAQTAGRREKLGELNDERLDMKRAHKHMPKHSREWREFNERRLANRQSMREVQSELSNLEKTESRFKFSGNMEIEFARLREKLGFDTQIKGLDSIPVLGTVVAAAGVYLGTKDDMEKGWGFWHSVGVESGSAVVSIVAGNSVIEGGELLGIEGAGVAGTVLVSAGVAYGVGSEVDELFKSGHWSQNIHDHGVLGGVVSSVGDASKTCWNSDILGMKDKIVNSAEAGGKWVWNHVF